MNLHLWYYDGKVNFFYFNFRDRGLNFRKCLCKYIITRSRIKDSLKKFKEESIWFLNHKLGRFLVLYIGQSYNYVIPTRTNNVVTCKPLHEILLTLSSFMWDHLDVFRILGTKHSELKDKVDIIWIRIR